jgi:hypothetical protein
MSSSDYGVYRKSIELEAYLSFILINFSKSPNKRMVICRDAEMYLSWVCLCGPVIQANGRLIFEDDLRSGGLLGFTTQ